MKDSPAKKRLHVKDYYQHDGAILFYADAHWFFLCTYYLQHIWPEKLNISSQVLFIITSLLRRFSFFHKLLLRKFLLFHKSYIRFNLLLSFICYPSGLLHSLHTTVYWSWLDWWADDVPDTSQPWTPPPATVTSTGRAPGQLSTPRPTVLSVSPVGWPDLPAVRTW